MVEAPMFTFAWLISFSSAACRGAGISHTHLFFLLFLRFWRFFSCLSSLTLSSSENSSQSCSNRLMPCTFSTAICLQEVKSSYRSHHRSSFFITKQEEENSQEWIPSKHHYWPQKKNAHQDAATWFRLLETHVWGSSGLHLWPRLTFLSEELQILMHCWTCDLFFLLLLWCFRGF